MFHLIHRLRPQFLNTISHQLGDRIQRSLKPSTVSLVAGAAQDAVRSKANPPFTR